MALAVAGLGGRGARPGGICKGNPPGPARPAVSGPTGLDEDETLASCSDEACNGSGTWVADCGSAGAIGAWVCSVMKPVSELPSRSGVAPGPSPRGALA